MYSQNILVKMLELLPFNLFVERDCLKKLHEIKSDPPLLGRFIPRCNPDGTYEPMQCHGKSKCVFYDD